MGRVQVLSEQLINQIAAGEVVERPASVVKELCENALDAGARSIRVALSQGGLSAISVTDDGCGMSREDAALALERHATSKLRELSDLFHISTMGFRGEALPAIASVSRFTLVTSEVGASVGTRVRVEAGGAIEVSDAPPIGGTRVDVEDLFFSVPARRKFLRRPSTELSHCEEAVVRLALARPDVAFTIEHDGRTVLTSAASADPRERIAAALGQQVHAHLLEVEERRLGLEVTGFVASPEFTLATARGLYAFVNRRYVRDRGLNHAIQRAFQESLPPGRQPVAILFIELDPAAVDVNVHPQKLEVRFQDGRSVYDAVNLAVSRALRRSVWVESHEEPKPEPVAGAHYADAVDRFLSRAAPPLAFGPPPVAAEPIEGWRPVGFGQARPQLNEAPPPGYFGSLRFLGTLGRRFLVCEGKGGTLVVVDSHAALERVRLTELEKSAGMSSSQGLLFSQAVELPADTARLLDQRASALERLGLMVEPFGGNTFAVKGMPPSLQGADWQSLLVELAPALPREGESLAPALGVLACHAATSVDRNLAHDEVKSLFAQLDEADFGLPALHGTVVVTEIPFLELERRAR